MPFWHESSQLWAAIMLSPWSLLLGRFGKLFHEPFRPRGSVRYKRPVPKLTSARLQEPMRHHWPGNVRELRNVTDRMMLGLPAIDGADGKQLSVRSLDEQMAMLERHLVDEALTSCGGCTAAASELRQVPKRTFYDRLKRLGLAADDFKLL